MTIANLSPTITEKSPALKARSGDAVLLARTFLKKYAKANGNKLKGFSKDALMAIESHQWPGNVRELENKVKRSAIMAEGSYVTAEELQLDVPPEGAVTMSLREVRDKAEEIAVVRALAHVDGNVSKAAELLSISRPTLYDLMNKYGLK